MTVLIEVVCAESSCFRDSRRRTFCGIRETKRWLNLFAWRSLAKDSFMAMLTVYADKSGTDGSSPMVADGGYVCTVELWDDFQVEWDRFYGPRRESRVS